jgi:hypothetical protein
MKTSDIQNEIERTGYTLKDSDISNQKSGVDFSLLCLSFGQLNSSWSEVNTCDLPAMLGKGNDIGARAAPHIDRIASRVFGYKIQKFRRRNAAIPWRFKEIPDIEI